MLYQSHFIERASIDSTDDDQMSTLSWIKEWKEQNQDNNEDVFD